VSISSTYNTVDGYYEIFGLPPGRYGVEVFIDAAEPYNTDHGFPDDYEGWKSPIIINEEDITVTQDLVVRKVIHLTSPVDNIEKMGHTGDEKDTYDGSPLFTWDPITEASQYYFAIQIYSEEPFGYLGQAYSTTTSLTSLQPELPLNEENEFYLCDIYAYNEAETRVGILMVSYDNGHGWDYRFKIEMRAQP
jgi:hypothetical protein